MCKLRCRLELLLYSRRNGLTFYGTLALAQDFGVLVLDLTELRVIVTLNLFVYYVGGDSHLRGLALAVLTAGSHTSRLLLNIFKNLLTDQVVSTDGGDWKGHSSTASERLTIRIIDGSSIGGRLMSHTCRLLHMAAIAYHLISSS